MNVGGRFSCVNLYRYGFNGHEKDDEVSGSGNSYDFGARMYSPRLGRFLSVDPLTEHFPHYSPYQFAGNTPIQAIDLDGAEEFHYTKKTNDKGETVFEVSHVEDIVDYVMNWETLELEKVVNQRQEYTLHETHQKFLNGNIIEHDASKTFDSYDEMVEAGDVGYTLQDFGYGLLQGLENVAEEKMGKMGGKGGYSYTRMNKSAPKPTVAYNRRNHYGNTPKKSDRTALGANKDQVVDHTVPLVQHYYEGDGNGGKPGYMMTKQQRVDFANDRSRMQLQDKGDSHKQGGQMSNYSKQKKKEHGL